MMRFTRIAAFSMAGCLWMTAASAELGAEESAQAAANYQRYCSLCHGKDRQGYVNDHAPSLRSESLMNSGYPKHLELTITYGRAGTPMGAYHEDLGGPMTDHEIKQLVKWLGEQVEGIDPMRFNRERIEGDIALGQAVYSQHCTECHGENGEGITGPAIGNPAMLSNTTDGFIRFAIENGRDGTQMQAWSGTLSEKEINGVTAFLRSRVSGWEQAAPVLRTPPAVDEYVLNPDGGTPQFEWVDQQYITSAELDRLIKEKKRMVLLDTRVMSMWQMTHIEGSVPIPYYYEMYDDLIADLPDDDTWIFMYCECPRAAAESVQHELRDRGFNNTAVLWEGIQGWAGLGYPVKHGQTLPKK